MCVQEWWDIRHSKAGLTGEEELYVSGVLAGAGRPRRLTPDREVHDLRLSGGARHVCHLLHLPGPAVAARRTRATRTHRWGVCRGCW